MTGGTRDEERKKWPSHHGVTAGAPSCYLVCYDGHLSQRSEYSVEMSGQLGETKMKMK
jgi:hypothetical protein